MRTVLIVSPHVPPINAPDFQRVRMSAPYYEEFGWNPVFLGVTPDAVSFLQEPLLLKTIPEHIVLHRVKAIPLAWTKKIGITTIALRAFAQYYFAGLNLIRQHKVDLIYFSTTMFPLFILGRLWNKSTGTPYVFDMQDPWVSDYYEHRSAEERPPKYRTAQTFHRCLEPFAMKRASGIIAVSEAYHRDIRKRYPWIREDLCATLPFGASVGDFKVAEGMSFENTFFKSDDGCLHGVYAGVLGNVMKQTCRAICLALKSGLSSNPELFSRLRLHFIGTSYDAGPNPSLTIRPIAQELGIEKYIYEEPRRQSYLNVLRLLKEAAFLLMPGSDNPQYTASKVYPYILAGKPLLAIFHEASSVVSVIKNTRAGEMVCFSSNQTAEEIAKHLLPVWENLLGRLPFTPSTNWQAFEPFSARSVTQKECALFDRVLQHEKH